MGVRSWLQNNPRILEVAYNNTKKAFIALDPVWKRVGYERVNSLIHPVEEWSKKAVFDCKMCGQCILHSTGMTCPMTCPKNLRNGPCGGVRANGNCEVIPEMPCVWVQAFERTAHMGQYGDEMILIQPPVNRMLEGSSAWVNLVTGDDKKVNPGWEGTSQMPLIPLHTK